MSNRIRVLDEVTINKIAAGEVIENPASVVKELVENSLDAGATEIHVEIVGGGRQLIRIADNGCGMSQDDALLCLERYATSKIRQLDDLEALATMGFRGEALPSIASISKMTLLTAVDDALEGTLVIIEGGRVLKCYGAARSKGTTIEVKSLFFNVPVRKKFQKSPAHDSHAVQKVMTLLALAYPEVRLELVSDQKLLLKAPAAVGLSLEGLSQRIHKVQGDEFHSHLVPLQISAEGYQLMGYIGLPTMHRPNRLNQYLFVNRRGITSHLVSAAIREGYGTSLPAQRYPVFVLHMQLAGDLLDVNVHPQKREVRLRQEQQLRELLQRAVGDALQRGQTSPVESSPHVMSASLLIQQPLPWDLPNAPQAIPKKAPEASPLETLFKPRKPSPCVLTTLPGYLILDPASCEGLGAGDQGLWLVDQRAAHQRILHDRLNAALPPKAIESFGLLIPETIQLTPLEMTTLQDVLPDLEKLGIQVEPFGPQTLSIQSIPAEFDRADFPRILVELAQELQEGHGAGKLLVERRMRIVAKMSQTAVLRRVQMSLSEAQQLVSQLFQCDSPYHCPLGKPILTCLKAETLAKHFQR